MKPKININMSPRLASILNNPESREQLRKALSSDRETPVKLDGQCYAVGFAIKVRGGGKQ